MIESGVPKNGWRFMSLADNQGRDTLERWFDKEIDQGQRKGVETAIKTTLRFLRFARKDLWKRPHFQWFSGRIGEVRSDYGNIEISAFGMQRSSAGPIHDFARSLQERKGLVSS